MKKVFTKKGLVAIALLTSLCTVESTSCLKLNNSIKEKKALIDTLSKDDEEDFKKIEVVENKSDNDDSQVKKSKKKKVKLNNDNKEEETESVVTEEPDVEVADVEKETGFAGGDSIDEKNAGEFLSADDEPESVDVSFNGPLPGEITDETLTENVDEGNEETEESTEIVREPVVETDSAYEVVGDYYKVKKDTKELVSLYIDREDNTFTKVVIPKGVKSIAPNAFEGHKYIEEVTFAEGSTVKSIGDGAFGNCSGITTFVMADSVTEIGKDAFINCSALTDIKLSAKLKTIGMNAFDRCFSINELTIPKTVKNGTEIMGSDGCANKVIFEKGTQYIPTSFLKNAKGVKAVVMYKGVTVIRKNAFLGCSALASINSPTTLKKINKGAFEKCYALRKYRIKPSLHTIGASAFRDCETLESLLLNKTVKTIGKDAFAGASNLTVKVVANSMQKKYAIKNNIKWTYTNGEMIRRNLSFSAKKKLEEIVKNSKDEYVLKKLKDYVPQGVCRAGNYTIISAYKSGKTGRSILLIYDKNGEYKKFVYVPNCDHVGSICTVKGKIVLSLNNISTTDYLAVISPKKIRKTENGKTLKYDYKVRISGRADYTTFDGTYLWAGHSFDKERCALSVYKVSYKKVKVSKKKKEKRLVFSKKRTYSAPSNVQGVVVNNKGNGKREVILSQSYGVIPDSHLYVYKCNINKDKSLGEVKDTYRLPSMLEGIAKKGKYMYLLFESAAGKYTKDDEHQTEIQINKLYRIKYDELDKLYKD